MEDNELIEKLRRVDGDYREMLRDGQALTSIPDYFPPASPELIARTENELGFRLPQLLRRLYLEVANGGFGPGIVGLEGGATDDDNPDETLLDLYRAYCGLAEYLIEDEPEVEAQPWPTKLLPVCGEGCNLMLCLDCGDENIPVIRYDPHFDLWGRRFIQVYPSFRDMISRWVERFSD